LSLVPQNLVDAIFDDLRAKIINGGYLADQRLTISELAKGSGVSAIPVREALSRLAGVGLVTYTTNHGYRVAPHLSQQGFINLFEARLAIDLAAIPGLIKNVSKVNLAKLNGLNKEMSKCSYRTNNYEHFRDFMQLNAEFHRAFIQISGNPFLLQIYDDLYIEMFVSRHIINESIDFRVLVHGHEEVLEALRERSPFLLKEKMVAHLNEGINLIFGYKDNIRLDVTP
jgi:DNA-binding GntR family transcriptional regulator